MSTTTSPLAPRRIAIAAVLALMLTGTSVVAFGLAEDAPLGAVPDSFGVPAPRIGDAGNYTYAVVDRHGALIGAELPFLEFEQLPARDALDAAGEPARVNRLSERMADYRYVVDEGFDGFQWGHGYGFAWATSATTGWPVFFELNAANDPFSSASNGSVSVAGVPVLRSDSVIEGDIRARIYIDAENSEAIGPTSVLHFCGARNALQGTTVDTSEPLPLLACFFRNNGADPTRTTLTEEERDAVAEFSLMIGDDNRFRALGTQTIGDRDLLAFGRVDGSGDQTATRVQVWMSADIAYPVQLAVRPAGSDQTHVVRLVSFHAGAEPLANEGPVGLSAAPSLSYAPSTPWGLDDSDAVVDISASEAWTAAIAADDVVARFLTDHPNAYLYSLDGTWERGNIDGYEYTDWSFGTSDGTAALEFTVQAVVKPLVPVPPLLGLGTQSPKSEPEYSVQRFDAHDPPTMAPSLYPTQLPTAASVIERAMAFGEMDKATARPLWGLQLVCVESEDDEYGDAIEGTCTKWAVQVLASEDHQDARLDATSTPGQAQMKGSYAFGVLAFEEDGSAIQWFRFAFDGTTVYQPAATAPPQSVAPYQPPPGADSGPWQVPTSAKLVGAGVLGLLVSAFYLFWPVLKGSLFGLYARFTGNELLEQPARRTLVSAVEASPGIHLKELARQTGLGWGTVNHHMRKLVDGDILVARKQGGYTCYFVRGGTDRRMMEMAGVLKAPGSRRLLEAVARQPDCAVGHLARDTGLAESTTHYHLKRLEAAGLVATVLREGARRATLTALGREAQSGVARYAPPAAVAA